MQKKRVAVLISGSGTNLQALIDATSQPDFPAEIALVISNKMDAYGLKRAEIAGILTRFIFHKEFSTREAFDEALHAALLEARIDLVCLAGFMRLLSPPFVSKWENRMINIHPSLLPAFKGAQAQTDALAHGVKLAGCSVHFVIPEMDSGPIIAQAAIAVAQDETAESLREKVLKLEHRCYGYALEQLALGNVHVLDGKALITGQKSPESALFSF